MIRIVAVAALLATAMPALAQVPAATGAEAERLRRLFHETDEAMLRRHPVQAIFRGDLRYADRFEPMFDDAALAAEEQADTEALAALARIDRARLGATDRVAYDVFRYRTDLSHRGHAPALVAISRVLPIDHLNGVQTWYPEFASGKGAAPFKTVLDYDNNLKRNAAYAAALDRAVLRLRDGMASGIVHPKLVVRNMIAQFTELAGEPVEQSTFYQPVTMFPDAVPVADRGRLTRAYAAQVRDVLAPAHRRVAAFLTDTYLPAGRDTVGLAALPGGASLYRYALEEAVTLDTVNAEQLHQLGLAELARDRTAMEEQKARAGFTGTLAQFFEQLRTDKRFQPASADAVRDAYGAIAKRVDARVREQFSLLPKSPIELRPVPALTAPRAAPGSYQVGTPDGGRPGVFYYNTYDLPARSTWTMEDLYLHEAVPGHHFQLSLAQENEGLPAFMRFDGDTAFVEGWGLYAEGLGPELGMMTDPHARMGGLYGDAIRAVRLVLDTGIHAKGWTRDQAIDFMMANVPVSRTAATSEVERYIANPGQATAYKMGQLTILRLKAKARAALGRRFDVRAFHAQVLGTGTLPLRVLEAKIDAWIAAGGG
jgi:uncharacterized protein (DUF885 family)